MGHVIVIQQESAGRGYEARQDTLHGEGPTVGAALDRLLDQLGDIDEPLLLVKQGYPDRFFGQADFDRLQALQAQAKLGMETLSEQEQSELRSLIQKELRATIQRTDILTSQSTAEQAPRSPSA